MERHCTRDHKATVLWGDICPCGYSAEKARRWMRLTDPTHVIITDGSPEAEASIMRDRMEAERMCDRIGIESEYHYR